MNWFFLAAELLHSSGTVALQVYVCNVYELVESVDGNKALEFCIPNIYVHKSQ
ncbi:unnamed protein product [Cylicostephanus goldi]|uniref:Uncharacterized protein n=1 Tax=Cylicostephanus goldi TaxID=71465 RepID=A0A3P6SIH5_CYLGO|nr:unnamed protein product [Cylicostephanus goldi]